jgi:nitroreductase
MDVVHVHWQDCPLALTGYFGYNAPMVNETLKTILTRRSVRKYKSEQIPREVLQQIIEAGLHAPSAMGRQPWHIVAVRGLDKIAEVDREVKAATERMPDNPYREYVGKASYTINYHDAPTFIIVSGNTVLSPRNAAIDCALVHGNMFLAAHSLGVGSCWINQLNVLNDEPGFREYMTRLGIPTENRIFGCACFGYADGVAREAAPRKEGCVVFVE